MTEGIYHLSDKRVDSNKSQYMELITLIDSYINRVTK